MAVKPVYAVGLDAGSRKTRMVICVLEDRRIRFLGCSSVDSQGWIKGRIADQGAVADSILTALRDVEAMVGISVGSATVGMGGSTLRGGPPPRRCWGVCIMVDTPACHREPRLFPQARG